MGCFLQCFGLSKKRKRRKTVYKVLAAADQKHGSYEALDSSVTVNLAITENPINPYSNFRDECKEQTRVKSKKKVSFNLNVQIYEPNPTAYQILDSDEEENEKGTGNFEKRSSSSSILGENTASLTYPSNYRYYNCIDSYNEEDEIANEESDIDAYEDDDEFDDEDDWDDGNSDGSEDENEAKVHDENTIQKQSSEAIYSLLAEDRIKNQMLFASNGTELKPNLSGRERSQYIHSVLSPVENLTQWKAIKAELASSKPRRKENVPLEQKTRMPLLSEPGLNLSPCSLESNVLQSKPLLTEIAVDASLSNWLISPNVSKTTIHCQ